MRLLSESRQHAPDVKPSSRPRPDFAGIQQRRLLPGNQVLQRLLASGAIQAKLTVSQPGDPYEQEADRVADEVMRMPAPGAAADSMTPPASSRPAADILHGGQPLPAPLRGFFERRFGQDFGDVRVHTGAAADAAARSIQALAFTRGSDIVFDRGQYAPDTAAGRRLVAHELTHVVQQRRTPSLMIRRLSNPNCDTTATLPMAWSCLAFVNTCYSETFVPASSSALHVHVSVDYNSRPPMLGPEDFRVQVYKCRSLWWDQRIESKLGPNIPGCLEFSIASVPRGAKYYLKIYSRSNQSLGAVYNVWQGSRPAGVPTCSSRP